MTIKKLLIANRGEIARRITKTAHRMGIKVVAVYSEADKDMAFVQETDEAYLLGPAPASESYLRADKIIEIAKACGADAIHPGYGFLSENIDFAKACKAAGIIFVGPSVAAISAMALKSEAKQLMRQAGVPVTPGYDGDDQSVETLSHEAEKIGFPLLIKAIAGGGGKGMRRVEALADFQDALKSCQSEGQASFGDPRVLLEKYITKPRHIEVQVFGDRQGHVVHLFERDCSVQRRHQKVIEEAPAPNLPDSLRQRLFDAAVKAAKAIHYEGAGTIEFLVDASGPMEDAPVYFMEMNTRLQVEHPVTEAITGLDLVEWQLRVADGEALPLSQEAITQSGHAFEVRLYAEDPDTDFLPATGTLETLRFPEGARIDSGVRQGDAVSPYYDPMIAKIIVQGFDRQDALTMLSRALLRTRVGGLVSNLSFLRRLSAYAPFVAGDVDTGLIGRAGDALLGLWADQEGDGTPFGMMDGFSPNLAPRAQTKAPISTNTDTALSGDIMAPMPGKIIALFVKDGDAVKKGDRLLTLSAMKIEHTLKAPFDGIVTGLSVQLDEQLQTRGRLLSIENKGA